MRRPSFRKTVKCVSSVSTLTTEAGDLDAKVFCPFLRIDNFGFMSIKRNIKFVYSPKAHAHMPIPCGAFPRRGVPICIDLFLVLPPISYTLCKKSDRSLSKRDKIAFPLTRQISFPLFLTANPQAVRSGPGH